MKQSQKKNRIAVVGLSKKGEFFFLDNPKWEQKPDYDIVFIPTNHKSLQKWAQSGKSKRAVRLFRQPHHTKISTKVNSPSPQTFRRPSTMAVVLLAQIGGKNKRQSNDRMSEVL
jgi:hypothetical protein